MVNATTLYLHAKSVVPCDDIRQEANGKFILIGVYQGVIRVPVLPFHINLTWWIVASTSEIGSGSMNVRLRTDGGAVLFKGTLLMQINELSDTAIVLPPVPCQFQSEGRLFLEWRMNTENETEWETINDLEIKLDPSLAPSS